MKLLMMTFYYDPETAQPRTDLNSEQLSEVVKGLLIPIEDKAINVDQITLQTFPPEELAKTPDQVILIEKLKNLLTDVCITNVAGDKHKHCMVCSNFLVNGHAPNCEYAKLVGDK